MITGNVLAILGAALAVILTGIGSSIGMSWVQQAAAGVVTEEPEKYGKTMVLQLIPASNALYGFVVGFLIISQVLFTEGFMYSMEQGAAILGLCIPIAVVGFIACLSQSKVCVSGIHMVGKRVELSGRALMMAVFIEMFALLAFIISVLGVLSI